MAKLKVYKANGEITEYEITPVIEYAFEAHSGKGFHKALFEDQRQTDVYYIVWECIKRSGETVLPWGEKFVETLKGVEVLESDPLG